MHERNTWWMAGIAALLKTLWQMPTKVTFCIWVWPWVLPPNRWMSHRVIRNWGNIAIFHCAIPQMDNYVDTNQLRLSNVYRKISLKIIVNRIKNGKLSIDWQPHTECGDSLRKALKMPERIHLLDVDRFRSLPHTFQIANDIGIINDVRSLQKFTYSVAVITSASYAEGHQLEPDYGTELPRDFLE